jgi:hypothetical protein
VADIHDGDVLALDVFQGVDGDGCAELVAVLAEAGKLVTWRGARRGFADAPTALGVDPWPLAPLLVPAGHFGATTPCLALASRATKRLELVAPLSGVREPLTTLAEIPRAAALGDLRGDASLVLALACDGRTLAVLDEARRGTSVAVPHDLARCVTVLAGGRAIVVGFQESQSLAVLAVDDAGAWSVERELALPGFPRRACELDVDRDGDRELVVLGGDRAAWIFGFGEPGDSRAWRRDGAARLDWTTSKVPLDVAAGDFDGDGRGDLAVLAFADLEASLWCGFERSGPTVRTSGYAGQNALAIASGDFDGDGELDLAVANRDAQRVSVVRGLGRGELAWPLFADVATFPNGIVAGDLDGDGRAECVTVSAKTCAFDVVRFDGGRIASVQRTPIGPSAQTPVLGDLDGDARLDVAWIASDAHGARIECAFGDGRGALATDERRATLGIGASGADLAALDLDGDGALELVAANPEANELCVFERGGAAWFTSEPARLALAAAPNALAATGPRGELAVALAGPAPRAGVALVTLARDAAGHWTLVERAFVALAGVPLDVVAAKLSATGGELVVLGSDARDSATGWLAIVRDGAVRARYTPGLKIGRASCRERVS